MLHYKNADMQHLLDIRSNELSMRASTNRIDGNVHYILY